MLKNRFFSIFAVTALVGLAACAGEEAGVEEGLDAEAPVVDANAPVVEPVVVDPAAPVVTDPAVVDPAAPVTGDTTVPQPM